MALRPAAVLQSCVAVPARGPRARSGPAKLRRGPDPWPSGPQMSHQVVAWSRPVALTGRGWSWLRSGREHCAWMVVVEVRPGARG